MEIFTIIASTAEEAQTKLDQKSRAPWTVKVLRSGEFRRADIHFADLANVTIGPKYLQGQLEEFYGLNCYVIVATREKAVG